MPPFYRIAEVAFYSMINFLPYLCLALYPFRNRLRFSKVWLFFLIFLLTLIQIGIGLYVSLFPPESAAIISACSTLIYLIFYLGVVQRSFGKSLFTLLMLSNIANFAVVSSKCLEGLLFPELALQQYRWSFSVMQMAVQLIILIPLFFYIKGIYTDVMLIETKISSWKYMWLIPATFYLIWYHHIYSYEQTSLEIALQPKNTIFLLFINLGAFLVYHIVICLINEQHKTAELEEQNHQLTMQNLQYDNLKEKIEEARQAKHDVRHHITVMDNYLKKKEYDKLQSYLQSYKKSLPDDSSLIFCKHEAVNTLMLYFSQQAAKHQISFDAAMKLPEKINIPDNVLSVLLGNLLENALEACIAASDAAAAITVRGKTDADAVFFYIENTCQNELHMDKDGSYLSSKRPCSGIGISSVNNITRQYNGIFEIEHKKGKVLASVMLNMPKNSL